MTLANVTMYEAPANRSTDHVHTAFVDKGCILSFVHAILKNFARTFFNRTKRTYYASLLKQGGTAIWWLLCTYLLHGWLILR